MDANGLASDDGSWRSPAPWPEAGARIDECTADSVGAAFAVGGGGVDDGTAPDVDVAAVPASLDGVSVEPDVGPSRRGRRRPLSIADDDDSVTPVLGTILVLLITVLGIGAILLWGAPAIARIQAQNAQLAMIGEFEDLRASAQELSVPDHSRFPTVVLSDGSLSMEEGSRIMITANHRSSDPDCDFRITDWSSAGDTHFDVSKAGCDASATHVLYAEVIGSNTAEVANLALSSGTNDIGTADLFDGNWVFYLNDGGTPPTIYSEAWLVSTDRLAWNLDGSQSRSVYLDGGAVFVETDGTLFLDQEPAIGDMAFGTGYVGVWLRTFTATDYNSISGQGAFQVYLALTGNNLRIDEAETYIARYDFSGDLAEAWCNALRLRNSDLTGSSYTSEVADCGGDLQGVRSLKFQRTALASFEFRFLQAEIHAALIP